MLRRVTTRSWQNCVMKHHASCMVQRRGASTAAADANKQAAAAAAAQSEKHGWFKHHSLSELVKKHGLPLGIYYVTLTEFLVCSLTYLLHYDHLGAGDITNFMKWIGLEKWIDVDHAMSASKSIGPITISGKLVTNYAIAKAFVAVWAPLKIPFCMATLPYMRRAVSAVAFWRK